MKKMRLRAIPVIAALLASMLVVPASAETGLPYSEDFNGCNTFADSGFTENRSGAGAIVTTDAEHGKSMELNLAETDNNTYIAKSLGMGYVGKVGIEFSIKPGSGITNLFHLVQSEGTTFPIAFVGGKVSTGWTGIKTQIGTYTEGEWCDVKLVVDYDNDALDISLTDKSGKSQITNGLKLSSNEWNATISDLAGYKLQIWSAKNAKAYIDNVKIYRNPEEIKVSSEIPYSEDFSNYTDISAVYNAGFSNVTSYGSYFALDTHDAAHGQSLKLTPTTDYRDKYTVYSFKDALTGKIEFKYSINPGSDLTNLLWLMGSDNTSYAVSFKGGNIYLGYPSTGTNVGTYTAGNWYDVTLTLDLNEGTIKAVVVDAQGNEQTGTSSSLVTSEGKYSGTDLKSFKIQTWIGAGNVSAYYDNISVKYVQEEPETGLPYSEDFTGFSSFADSGFVERNSGVGSVVETDTAHGKSMAITLNSSLDNTYIKKTFDKAYSGKLGMEFSIKPGSGITNLLQLFDSKGEFNIAFVNGQVDTGYTGITSSPAGTYTEGQWCDVKLVLDYDNDALDISLTDESGKSQVKKGLKLSRNANSRSISDLTGYGVKVWSKKDVTTYLDNVKVYRDPEEIEIPSELPYSEDFSNYADISAVYNAGFSNVTSFGSYFALDTLDEAHGQSLKLTPTTDYRDKYTVYSFKDALTGKIEFKYSINPGSDLTNLLWLMGSDNTSYAVSFKGGNIYLGYPSAGTNVGTYTAGNWYDVTLTLDLNEGTIKAVVVDAQGNVQTGTSSSLVTSEGKYSGTDLKSFKIQTWIGAGNVSAYYDNISVKYDTEDPKLSADRVSFFDGESESKALKNVSSSANKIVLDFGATMKASTMKASNIVIKNVTDNKTVDYTGEIKGDTYVMTLNDNKLLGANKNYTITVSKAVANVTGTKLGNDVTIEFETGAAVLKNTLAGIKQNDAAVTAYAGLTAGTIAKTSINYINTTEKDNDMVLIYTYYKGGAMVKTVCKSISIDKEKQSGTYENEYKIESLNADTLKVMLWDGFDTLIPISEAITLK